MAPLSLSAEVLALLVCPVCRAAVAQEREALRCTGCGRVYPVTDGIPVMIAAGEPDSGAGLSAPGESRDR